MEDAVVLLEAEDLATQPAGAPPHRDLLVGRRVLLPHYRHSNRDQEERQDECDEGPRITSFGCRRRIASTRWTLGHPRFRTRSRSAQAMTISKQARMTMGVVDRLIA